MPEYFSKYIFQVDDIELDDAFQNNINTLAGLDLTRLESLADNIYAPGKWTIRDIFQHMIDTERVMSYRTLRFARRDGVIPQGYDQDLFAANADSGHRALGEIIDEFKSLHQATRLMFRSFSNETLQLTGYQLEQGNVSAVHGISHHRAFYSSHESHKRKIPAFAVSNRCSVNKKRLNT